jgi:hypothetical protein
MFENEIEIAWQAMPDHAPVVAADGSRIGTTEKVLGDLEDDIFHGVVIRRDDGEAVEIPAARIKRVTQQHVITDVGHQEAKTLPAYKPS